MGYRQIIGCATVWEDDTPGDDDLVGNFKWKLAVRQTNGVVSADMQVKLGDGSRWFDDLYNFTSKIDFATNEVSCKEAMVPEDDGSLLPPGVEALEEQVVADEGEGDIKGLEILVLCSSTADGRPPKIELDANLGASVPFSGGGDGTTGLGFKYSPGFSGQRLVWMVRLLACPTADGSPKITVLEHFASVSDDEYKWGSNIWPKSNEDDVTEAVPEIAIGKRNTFLKINRQTVRQLQFGTVPGAERTHRAVDAGVS